jgi:hypothetical protein
MEIPRAAGIDALVYGSQTSFVVVKKEAGT